MQFFWLQLLYLRSNLSSQRFHPLFWNWWIAETHRHQKQAMNLNEQPIYPIPTLIRPPPPPSTAASIRFPALIHATETSAQNSRGEVIGWPSPAMLDGQIWKPPNGKPDCSHSSPTAPPTQTITATGTQSIFHKASILLWPFCLYSNQQ